MASFTRTWQRPPTNEELAGLVRDRVREEVYSREAMALGLDRDDTVIRRLRQKMEFVSDDVAAQTEPTENAMAITGEHGETSVQLQSTNAQTPSKTEEHQRPESKTIQQLAEPDEVCKTSISGSNPDGASNFS